MRGYFHKKYFIITALVLMLSSCGPSYKMLNFEEKVPALFPVPFEGNSISIFVSLSDKSPDNEFMFFNDSLQMLNLALSMASTLEKQLFLKEEGIYVFKHYPDKDKVYDSDYIISLSDKSNSDIIIVVDSLTVGKGELNINSELMGAEAYKMNFASAPIRYVINLYDGFTTEKLQRIDLTDTVYWELLSRSDFKDETIKHKALESMKDLIATIAENIVSFMLPSWATAERTVYLLPGANWRRAYDLLEEFRWREAMDIWMENTTIGDPLILSVAAFNMAVACELTERPELALQWLEVSLKSYELPGALSYKQLLTNKLEKR